MKKMRIVALSAAVVLTLGITTAFAAGGRNYVDANGDGVCDNYGTGRGAYYVDADGDGVCDNRGANCLYVDADGDGVCDNYGTGLGGGHHGGRWGGGRGCGRW